MRAIIDADRLPTAVRYYTKFPGEPAQQLKNYISIDRLDAVKNLTLKLLLRKIAESGEKEFLIVVHSNPSGLILPVGQDFANIQADKSVLNIIRLASMAFDLLDDSKNTDLAVNAAFLAAWMDFFSQVPEADTSAITAASGIPAKCVAAAQLCQQFVKAACKSMHTNEARLRDIAALADKVRNADIERLEFRACRLGAGNGLKEVATFFGAMSFAPTVRTFYVHQPVQIVRNQAKLNSIARGLGGASRRFTAGQGAAGPNDDIAFAIQVTRLKDAHYTSLMFAINEQAVWDWVNKFISRLPISLTVNGAAVAIETSQTLTHNMVVAGFWTPESVKPFVFPREPEYPTFIEGQF